MDPNANLEEQRQIAARMRRRFECDRVNEVSTIAQAADGDRLAELVQALDDWLTRGGFKPVAWSIRSVKR